MCNSIITGIFTIAGALLGLTGVYFSQKWILSREIKIKDHEKKLLAYSELMGLKIILMQNYVSRFEALVFSDFFEFRWKKLGAEKDSIYLKEAQRQMEKSENLVFEISKTYQNIFEKLAIIKILFQQTNELDNLIKKLYHFQTPQIKRPDENMNLSQLEAYKTQAVKELQELVKKEYGDNLDELLKYLLNELRRKN